MPRRELATPTSDPASATERLARRGRVAAFLAVLLIATTTVLVPSTARADEADDVTWSVTPADASGPDGRGSIQQEIDPGQSREDFFAVRNLSRIPVTFTLTAADGYYTDQGRFNMLPSDEESVDAGLWITLPTTVTVEPNQTVVVPFTTTVPENAIPGDHAAGIAASVRSAGTDADGSQVGLESRVGFRIMTRVTGEVSPSIEASVVATDYALSWNALRPGVATVTFDVTNTGNASVVLDGAVTAGTGSAAFPAADAPRQELLPGESRRFTVAVSEVWPTLVVPGSIDLAPAAFAYGGEAVPMPPLSTPLTLWALPLPQLLIALGVGLIVAAMFWGRRRSRRRLGAAVAKAREEALAEASLASSTTTPTASRSPEGSA